MTKEIILLFAVVLLVSCDDRREIFNSYDKEESYATMQVSEETEIEPTRMSSPVYMDQVAEPDLTMGAPPTSNAFMNQNQKQDGYRPKTIKSSKAQKIIRSGRINIDVDDLQVAKTELDELMKSIDGYYESESYHNRYNTNEYHLTIRVPNAGFDKLTKSLDGEFGEITSKEINAKDVTEEYVDLGIRLESKLIALTSYQKFLKKATNVKEILQVQNEIRRIEEEIESKKGRLRFLDDQVTYSTLSINLVQHIAVVAKAESRHFGAQIQSAFINGYDGILSFIVGVVYVWPLWIVLTIIGFILKRKTSFFRKEVA